MLLALAFVPTLLLLAGSARAVDAPSVKLTGATNTLTGAAWVVMTWPSETWDTDAFHSTATNTSRITVPSGLGGRYLVSGQIGLPGITGSATNTFDVSVFVNGEGGDGSAFTRVAVTNFGRSQTQAILTLSAGDYIELKGRLATGSLAAQVTDFAAVLLDNPAVPTAGPTASPGPSASPVVIAGFAGDAATMMQTSADLLLVGFGVTVCLLAAILVSVGLRRH